MTGLGFVLRQNAFGTERTCMKTSQSIADCVKNSRTLFFSVLCYSSSSSFHCCFDIRAMPRTFLPKNIWQTCHTVIHLSAWWPAGCSFGGKIAKNDGSCFSTSTVHRCYQLPEKYAMKFYLYVLYCVYWRRWFCHKIRKGHGGLEKNRGFSLHYRNREFLAGQVKRQCDKFSSSLHNFNHWKRTPLSLRCCRKV